MKELLKKFSTNKEIWKMVEQKYFAKSDHSVSFISIDDAADILHECGYSGEPADVVLFSGAAAWRYTQGIYDFDKTLFDALTETEISDTIPSDVLYRLPEWTVFVNSYCLKFFCFHENDTLWFCVYGANEDYGMVWLPLPFNVSSSIEKGLESFKNNVSQSDYDYIYTLMKKCISILLYICSSEPDATPVLRALSMINITTKTKKGIRIFPPDKPKTYKIGYTVGEKLRNSATKKGSHSLKAPHIRRAHWHGYWTGDGKKKYIYKWIAPIFVGGD